MSSIIKVDQIQLADGSTPTAGDLGLNTTGSVLQVVRGYLDTRPSFGANQSTWVDVGLDASITPSSASSKILITCYWGWKVDATTADSNFRLQYNDNGGSYSAVNPPSSIAGGDSAAYAGNLRGARAYEGSSESLTVLHAPNSANTLNYKLQLITEANLQMNRGRQSGATRFGSVTSEIILMEIAG
jgi:hypothetical protein